MKLRTFFLSVALTILGTGAFAQGATTDSATKPTVSAAAKVAKPQTPPSAGTMSTTASSGNSGDTHKLVKAKAKHKKAHAKATALSHKSTPTSHKAASKATPGSNGITAS